METLPFHVWLHASEKLLQVCTRIHVRPVTAALFATAKKITNSPKVHLSNAGFHVSLLCWHGLQRTVEVLCLWVWASPAFREKQVSQPCWSWHDSHSSLVCIQKKDSSCYLNAKMECFKNRCRHPVVSGALEEHPWDTVSDVLWNRSMLNFINQSPSRKEEKKILPPHAKA